MSVGADALRRLAALDLPAEAFREVLSIFADMQAKDDERRAKQRERTQAARGRKRDGNVTVTDTVTDEERDSLVTTGEQKNKKVSDFQEQKKPKENPPKGGQKKNAGPLPADWEPSPQVLAFGAGLGLSTERETAERGKFRDWCAANAHRPIGKKLDWQAGYRNWLRTAAERIFERTHPPPKPDRTAVSLDRLQRQFAEENRRNGTFRDSPDGPVIDHDPKVRPSGH